MSGLTLIDGIADLSQSYDALLCDAWGVIHDGVKLFPDVAEALVRFRETRGPVIILTNAPRPSFVIPPQLDSLGLPREAYDLVVTSGDATRAEIAKFKDAPALRIGPDKDDALFEGLDVNFTALDEAEFIICTGLNEELTEAPEDYRERLKVCVSRGMPMVCANPDIIVNWGGKTLWCAGAIAEIYAQLGGAVIFGGKPHKPIYELSITAIDRLRDAKTLASRILAIGDGLGTDVAGANAHDIDVVFVAGAGGIHDGDADIETLTRRLKETNASAVAATERLSW